MDISSTIHSLIATGIALQVILAGTLLAKKMWAKFPMFTAYAVFSVLETAVAYAVYQNRSIYFWTYVIGESVSVVLGLSLVYEVFTSLFALHPGLRKLAMLIFRVAVLVLGALAAVVIYHRAPMGKVGIGVALLAAEEAARVLEVGLIMFLFLFSSAFGLHWRQWVFGIALGLGIFSAAKLTVVTMLPYAGSVVAQYLNLLLMISFNFSLLIWLGYLLVPERVASKANIPKRAQLEQWNQAIVELIQQ